MHTGTYKKFTLLIYFLEKQIHSQRSPYVYRFQKWLEAGNWNNYIQLGLCSNHTTVQVTCSSLSIGLQLRFLSVSHTIYSLMVLARSYIHQLFLDPLISPSPLAYLFYSTVLSVEQYERALVSFSKPNIAANSYQRYFSCRH